MNTVTALCLTKCKTCYLHYAIELLSTFTLASEYKIAASYLCSLKCLSVAVASSRKKVHYYITCGTMCQPWHGMQMNSLISLGFPLFFPCSLMRISSSEEAGRRLHCTFTMGKKPKYRHNAWIQQFQANASEVNTSSSRKMLSTATLTGNLAQNQGWAIPSFTFHAWLLKLFLHKKGFPVREASEIA